MGAYHESAYDAEMLIENVEEAIMRAKLLDVHKETLASKTWNVYICWQRVLWMDIEKYCKILK